MSPPTIFLLANFFIVLFYWSSPIFFYWPIYFLLTFFIGLHLHGFPRDGYEGDDYDHDGVDGCGDICTYKNAFKGMCLLA